MALPRALTWTLALLLGAAPLSACASDCAPVVEGGWIRNPPADLPMLAGYARIVNACDGEAIITGATSPAFSSASLHATIVEDGISKMRETKALHVAAGETAVLEPGGMHLMLMQPKRRLRQGEEVEIRFELADGRSLRGQFEVKGPRAMR